MMHVRKVVSCFGKTNCVSTVVRKHGNIQIDAMKMTLAVKMAKNSNEIQSNPFFLSLLEVLVHHFSLPYVTLYQATNFILVQITGICR